MKEIWFDIKEQFKKGDTLIKLIYVNGGIFVAMLLFQIIFGLITNSNFSDSLYLFHALTGLPINNLFEFLIKPYTLITHMFVHDGFWHILGNMLFLFFLGRTFLNYFTQKQLLGLYMLGGLVAGGSLLLITSLSPMFTSPNYAIGASAAVMSIVAGICFYIPNTKVNLFGVFPVKLVYIGAVVILQDMLHFDQSNTAGHLAHLIGAGIGYWYAASFRQGKDITRGINKIIQSASKLVTRKPKMKVVYSQEKVRKMSDEDYNTQQKVTQEEIDAILDKISASGYGSLTKREKYILNQYSDK
jgi:membrane associated rhomboid family serine protease